MKQTNKMFDVRCAMFDVASGACRTLLISRRPLTMHLITPLLLLTIATAAAQTRDYPKAPPDKLVHAQGAQQVSDLDRAMAPYVAKARKTYPGAKTRFLASLPPKYLFSVTTKLWDRSHTKFEVVFVVADQIKNGTVTGHLATHTKQPVGYNYGDRISFPESEVMDWTIVHPDGTEEGNIVGKFLDTYHG
jgi:hypothetical protein